MGEVKNKLKKCWKELWSAFLAWIRRPKNYLIVAGVIFILGILPIWPSVSTASYDVEIPMDVSTPDIPVRDSCSEFNPFYELKFEKKQIVKGTLDYPEFQFKDDRFGIFALRVCDTCFKNRDVKIVTPQECQLNNSAVYLYRRVCDKKSNYEDCEFDTFVVEGDGELIPYQGAKYKISFQPVMIQQLTGQSDGTRQLTTYRVDVEIHHKDWKGLPPMKHLIEGLKILLQPTVIVDYVSERWWIES